MINSLLLILLAVAVLFLSLGLRALSKRLDSQEKEINSLILDLGNMAGAIALSKSDEKMERTKDILHALRNVDGLKREIEFLRRRGANGR